MRTHCAVPGYAGRRSAYWAAMAGGTKRPWCVKHRMARQPPRRRIAATPHTHPQVVVLAREAACAQLGRGERDEQLWAQPVARHVTALHVPA